MFDLGEEEEEHLYFVPLDEGANEENLEEWEKHLMIEKMFPVDREFIHISDAFSSEEERAALSKQLGYVRDQAVHLYQSAKSICRGTIKKSSKYERVVMNIQYKYKRLENFPAFCYFFLLFLKTFDTVD